MKKLKFKDEFVAFWGGDDEAQERIAEAAILEAFREGLINSKMASKLLDMSTEEFFNILNSKNISMRTSSQEINDDWMDDPEILDLLIERDKKVEKEIREGCFSDLEDFRSELGF